MKFDSCELANNNILSDAGKTLPYKQHLPISPWCSLWIRIILSGIYFFFCGDRGHERVWAPRCCCFSSKVFIPPPPRNSLICPCWIQKNIYESNDEVVNKYKDKKDLVKYLNKQSLTLKDIDYHLSDCNFVFQIKRYFVPNVVNTFQLTNEINMFY